MPSHSAVIACLVVVLAGCAGAVPSSSNHSPADAVCAGGTWVSFYALGEEQIWDADSVVVGFDLSAGAEVLLVAFENDSVLGVRSYSTERGVHVDGFRIPLETRLSGRHTIRVVMYGDVNRNGEFDPERDRPCRDEGDIIQTAQQSVNFSSVADTSTASL